jgi:hypothetical protein
MATPLTVDEVRAYVSDYAPNNYLIEGEEFSDTFITLCMTLAVDDYNIITPISRTQLENFPSKSILLLGTCAQMYRGKSLQFARNQLQYSDGGLQVAIEERAELYSSLASSFNQQFRQSAQAFKIQNNMESGWGGISSDEAYFPMW